MAMWKVLTDECDPFICLHEGCLPKDNDVSITEGTMIFIPLQNLSRKVKQMLHSPALSPGGWTLDPG